MAGNSDYRPLPIIMFIGNVKGLNVLVHIKLNEYVSIESVDYSPNEVKIIFNKNDTRWCELVEIKTLCYALLKLTAK